MQLICSQVSGTLTEHMGHIGHFREFDMAHSDFKDMPRFYAIDNWVNIMNRS
jgi:hypothetical protein